MPNYPNGSISHATMRIADLIPCFAAMLEDLASSADWIGSEIRAKHQEFIAEICAVSDDIGFYDSEYGADILDTLFDALNVYAAPGSYFGAHEGDGSDYGYWPAAEDSDAQID